MQDAISIETAAAWIPALHPRLFRLARAVVYTDREATAVVHASYLRVLSSARAEGAPDDIGRLLEDAVFLGALRERVRLRGQLLQLLDAAAGAQPPNEISVESLDYQARGRRVQTGDNRKPGDVIADNLSDMLRVVFVMLDVIGMSVPEVARLLHIQEATVESRAQRARALVSEQLEGMGIMRVPEIYAVSEAQCRTAVGYLRAIHHSGSVPASV